MKTKIVLSGGLRVAVLLAVAAGAIGGVALTVGWPSAPAWMDAAAYLALGWVAVVAAPDLVERLPGVPLVLLVAGGLLYSAGAVVYATRRPDPWPRTFGFHEVFHTLVILAAVAHFTAIAGWVIPAGA